MENLEALEKFGLSKKEAKTYVSCLNLGSSTASEIALKGNLPRTLTYDLLEKLIELGLISYSIKDKKKYFTASNPKEFIRIIKEKEMEIKSILPKLERAYNIKGFARPKVKIYEGKEGMKTIMNELLNSGIKEFFAYGSSRSSYEIIPSFMDDWHKRRIKKKIIMNILYNNTKQTREKIKDLVTLKYSKYKLMPIELESPTAMLIYEDKVILQSWTKEPFSVMIQDKQMVDNQREYFKELWKIAKK